MIEETLFDSKKESKSRSKKTTENERRAESRELDDECYEEKKKGGHEVDGTVPIIYKVWESDKGMECRSEQGRQHGNEGRCELSVTVPSWHC
jgi:hypothetical protein